MTELIKRKICIIITTRGNYAKMKSVIRAISRQSELELQVVVGGSAILRRYGSIHDVINNEVKINQAVHFVLEGENPITMAKSAGLAVTEFSTAFGNLQPDVVLVIADRFESLAIAMAASYMNIALAHIEGGEVSGSIDESIRHAITKLSHFHFPASKGAAERIERLGEDKSRIFTVGCTSLDIINEMDLANVEPIMELQNKYGVGETIDLEKPYLVVIQHPVTTEFDQNTQYIKETIHAIESLKMETIWIWPNMDAGSDEISKEIRVFREEKSPEYIHFFKSLPIEYYGPLLNNASCIVGNSSSGIRESAFLGVPCVNIGSRQEGRERSKNVIDVENNHIDIKKSIVKQLTVGRYSRDFVYGKGDSGNKIAETLSKVELFCQKKITY